ncbi:hypothetical protein [Trinickia sp. EG282A]|uniref:hypothetical protein n=1 Tax=Trinickia sp. EG282A TaxID=3237013 RepID=UPI0034D2AF25
MFPNTSSLWTDGVCLGSQFFGGVIGNLTANLLWEGGKWIAKPVVDRVPELAELLSAGGHDGNHNLLRALRRAECEALVEMVDGAMLDCANLRLGDSRVAEMLKTWVKAHNDEDIATLLRIRRAFQRTGKALHEMSVDELKRMHGMALKDVQGLVRAGSESLSVATAEQMRERVTSEYVTALDRALTRPSRMGSLSKQDLNLLAKGGLPESLRRRIEAHPGGWWDALRLAFREELKNPANPEVMKAWELDVQCHLVDQLGSTYGEMSKQLDAIDEANYRQWKDWLDFRDEFDRFAEDLAGSIKKVHEGVARIEDSVSVVRQRMGSIEEMLASLSGATKQELEALRSQQAATLEEVSVLVRAMLDQPELPPDQVRPALEKALAAYRTLRGEVEDLRERVKDFPDVQVELSIAAAAFKSGSADDMAQAEQALEAAKSRFRATIKRRQIRDAEIEHQLLAQQGRLAEAQLRFLDAAALWKEAGDCLVPELHVLRAESLFREGSALYEQGQLFGGTSKLRDAVRCFDTALTLLDPLVELADWARTQSNRAAALRSLGERLGGEEGLQALRDALASDDAALEVRNCGIAPADWARTQNNRASGLHSLGERLAGEEGLQALRDALTGYDAALEVNARETMPAEWAATQNNRAAALQCLGERLGGDEGLQMLRDAINGYDAALGIYTRKTVPADWARTQSNRAMALVRLGERLGDDEGLKALRDALAAYDAALEIYTRKTVPAEWARTQSNRAMALVRLGERLGDDEGLQALRDALAAYDAALEIYTREAMPAYWAVTQDTRASTLLRLGERLGSAECLQALRDALTGYDAALEVHARKTMPVEWAMTQNNRAVALQSLSERLKGDEGLQALRDALAGYDAALEVRTRETMPAAWATTEANREVALKRLADRSGPDPAGSA